MTSLAIETADLWRTILVGDFIFVLILFYLLGVCEMLSHTSIAAIWDMSIPNIKLVLPARKAV